MTDQTQQLTFGFQQHLKIQDSEPTTDRNNVPEEEEEDGQQHEQEQEPVAFEHEEDDDDDDDEEEFSFSCSNPDGSPISPSSAFRNGQIRPLFPLFDTSLLLTGEAGAASSISSHPSSSSSPTSLKKLFSGDRVEAVEEVTVSETCRKSNSTGHSKVWKFRDLMTTLNRSNSDGKDAFVFLKNGHSNERESGKSEKVPEKKTTKSKTKTASSLSAHEKLYVKNRERKEGEKRKSYLPYRQGLVGLGFFY